MKKIFTFLSALFLCAFAAFSQTLIDIEDLRKILRESNDVFTESEYRSSTSIAPLCNRPLTWKEELKFRSVNLRHRGVALSFSPKLINRTLGDFYLIPNLQV